MTEAVPFQRWRVVVGVLAAAVVLMLVLGTGQGRGTASDFLAAFRGDRFEEAALSTDHIANIEQTMTELERLGTVSGIETMPDPQPIASVGDASEFVGFTVLVPDPATLPEGVGETPAEVRVVPAHEIRFTFDLDKARDYVQSIGQGDVNLPERFDGTSLVVQTPASVVLQYRHANVPADSPFGIGLIVGQSGVVTVEADGGVTLDELQDFLLGLPGHSPEVVRQLLELDNWKTVLPMPIPVDQVYWERATIAGSPGLLLNDNTGIGSAALWERDGRIIGIAGAMKARELRDVAESFR